MGLPYAPNSVARFSRWRGSWAWGHLGSGGWRWVKRVEGWAEWFIITLSLLSHFYPLPSPSPSCRVPIPPPPVSLSAWLSRQWSVEGSLGAVVLGVGNGRRSQWEGYNLVSKNFLTFQGRRPNIFLSSKKGPWKPWEWKGLGAEDGSEDTPAHSKESKKGKGGKKWGYERARENSYFCALSRGEGLALRS